MLLYRANQALRLASDSNHWTTFDQRTHAACAEPRSGPSDAFNLDPLQRLEPGETIAAWFLIEWFAHPGATS